MTKRVTIEIGSDIAHLAQGLTVIEIGADHIEGRRGDRIVVYGLGSARPLVVDVDTSRRDADEPPKAAPLLTGPAKPATKPTAKPATPAAKPAAKKQYGKRDELLARIGEVFDANRGPMSAKDIARAVNVDNSKRQAVHNLLSRMLALGHIVRSGEPYQYRYQRSPEAAPSPLTTDLPRQRTSRQATAERAEKIVQTLRQHQRPMSKAEISMAATLDPNAAAWLLKRMVQHDKLRRHEQRGKPQDQRFTYTLPEEQAVHAD